MLHRRTLLLYFAIICVITLLFRASSINGNAQVKTKQIPQSSLARYQFSTLDGQRMSLESMRGQVVVLHFFGTWCGYSKAQVRKLHELTQNGMPKGLQILGLSVKDPLTNPQALRQFIMDQQVNYPVVSQVEDNLFSKFVESRDVSVPQTLIYGSDGKLVAHFNGYSKQINEQILGTIKTELEKAGER